MDTVQTHAVMAMIAKRLIDTKANYICLIAKNPDGYIDVYLNDAPLKGPELHKRIDELKDVIKRLQETINEYESKARFNG